MIIGVVHAWFHITVNPLNDVPGYYQAASRLNSGEPLYQPEANPDLAEFYRYPPLLAIVLRPFALLPYPVFAVLWEAGTILAFALFVRELGFTRRTAIALGILGNSIGDVLPIGQAQMHVAWLLAMGTPLSIALAGQIKIFPALAALYWLGRGDYRHFIRFLEWTAALTIVQFVISPASVIGFGEILSLDQVGSAGQLSPYSSSPLLWLSLAFAGLVVTPLLARTRVGWAAAVAYATLVTPRLFGYHLLSLGAAIKAPGPP